jgi:predicted dehydrogenase
MSSPLRIGLIGCGRIAELGHAPAIAASPSAVLAAVTDPVAERAAALADRSGAHAFATAQDLLASDAVEAVIVASPAARHIEHARAAADAGLPCLVEKPPAPDAAGAARLAALERPPWIGFNRRFRQGALVAELPADGHLDVELELRYRRRSWRPHGRGDDALLDLGPHLADLALLLGGGGTTRVIAATASHERARFELEGQRGRVIARCATDRPHLERAIARRPGGETVAAMADGGLWKGALARLARRPHPLGASMRAQLEAFCAAARGGEPGRLATASDGLRAMELVDEAVRLARAASDPATAVAA